MSAPWYSPSGNPASDSSLSSSTIRSELTAIETAMDKLPSFSGNANLPVYVNAGASALEARSTGPYLHGDNTEVSVGGLSADIQVHTTSRANSFIQYSADAVGAKIYAAKTRSATVGTVGTVVQDNDVVLQLIGYGDDGTDLASEVAYMKMLINGTPGSNDMPGEIVFGVTADGNPSADSEMVISGGVYGTGATGGAQGVGTSNWTAVYDDGAGPLTDYVLDYAQDHTIDFKFYARTQYGDDKARAWNPYDLIIESYVQRWRKRRALPPFPTKEERFNEVGQEMRPGIGALTQGLLETVEVHAVHVGELNERLCKVEDILMCGINHRSKIEDED